MLTYPCGKLPKIAFSSVYNHETTEQPNAPTENGAHKSKDHKAKLNARKIKQGSQCTRYVQRNIVTCSRKHYCHENKKYVPFLFYYAHMELSTMYEGVLISP